MVTKKNASINKAASIRELVKTNRSMSVADIIATLGAEGVKVTPPQVYQAKNSMKKKRKSTAITPSSNGSISHSSEIALMLAAKQFLTAAGSSERAIEVLRNVQKILA